MVLIAVLSAAMFTLAALTGIALLVRMVRHALPQVRALHAAQRGEAPLTTYHVKISEVVRRPVAQAIPAVPVFASRARLRPSLTKRTDRPQQHAAAA